MHNSILKKDILIQLTIRVSVTYDRFYAVKLSKRDNHPFKIDGQKPTLLENLSGNIRIIGDHIPTIFMNVGPNIYIYQPL